MFQLTQRHTALAVVVNHKFVIGYKAMLNSVLTHTQGFDLPVVCVDLDLTEDDRQEMLALYPETSFTKPIEANYNKLPPHAKALRNAFYKVEVLRIAQKYERTVFVDCDIVFIDSIFALLMTDMKSDIAACPIPAQPHEVNTGVMVFRKLATDRYQKVIDMMKLMERAYLADQPVIINAIAKKILSYQKLHNKWNTTKREVKAGKKNFVGIHFVGRKPFNGGEAGYEEIEKIWWRYCP